MKIPRFFLPNIIFILILAASLNYLLETQRTKDTRIDNRLTQDSTRIDSLLKIIASKDHI
jgi:hypothetical protein